MPIKNCPVCKNLLNLQEKSKYDGAPISIENHALFLKNIKSSNLGYNEDMKCKRKYIMDFLVNSGYLEIYTPRTYILTPKALERVYELQKANSINKEVFVSIAFNANTKNHEKLFV